MGYAQGSNTVNTANIVDAAVTTGKIADEAVTLAKLKPTGTSGQVLTSAGTGADPSYQTAAASDPAAFSGAIETDGTFVATTQPFTMPDGSGTFISTVKDAGANSTVELWAIDVSGVVGGSAAASVTLTGAATPTSIAESMGYVIVGSEDGISIIDSYDGSWAERTEGWPRSLSTSTTPALNNNNVIGVTAAVLSTVQQPDLRTGRSLPTFGVKYGTGTFQASVIKTDGNVFDTGNTTATAEAGVAIWADRIHYSYSTSQFRNSHIPTMTANETVNPPYTTFGTGADSYGIATASDAVAAALDTLAVGSGEGLAISHGMSASTGSTNADTDEIIASVTRAFNTGMLMRSSKGVWLANSPTVGRGTWAKTLTANGTVTEAAVETGSELKGYSGWSSSNNLTRSSDEHWDVLGTGAAYMSIWFKSSSVTATERYMMFGNSGNTVRMLIHTSTSGQVGCIDDGATANVSLMSTEDYDDGAWHKADFVRVSSTERYFYVDGVQVLSSTTNAGSLSSSGNLPLGIGVDADGSTYPATSSTLSLGRFSSTAPSAAQVLAMYEAEKGLFVASAKCLLQSGTTDSVLDVSVDPNGKVAVTQTDSMTIWDGLVATTQATSGANTAFEHLKSWNDTLIEVGATDLSISRPAENIRAVVDRVDVLESEFAGVDLSKAKAWCYINNAGTIFSSYNIESVSKVSTGRYRFNFGTHFKSNTSYTAVPSIMGNTSDQHCVIATNVAASCDVFSQQTTSASDQAIGIVFFGELEGE